MFGSGHHRQYAAGSVNNMAVANIELPMTLCADNENK